MEIEIPDVGPWAKEKLDCLEKYLGAYTRILSAQDFLDGYFYVDAFAGLGKAEVRNKVADQDISPWLELAKSEPQLTEYIDGSPLVALKANPHFTRYLFIEKNIEKAKGLGYQIAQYKKGLEEEVQFHHEIYTGDANSRLLKLANRPARTWHRWRGVIFLDPYGMHVPWSTVEALARTGAIEVLVNFPLGMAIRRLLPASHDVSPAHKKLLDSYFGTDEWWNVVYETSDDLFSSGELRKKINSEKNLALWYRNRLEDIFGFASPPRLIRNSKGGHLYYLIFAGPNETGAKVAKHILSQGETIGN